jgi:Cu-Zn family superoxide dismutase
MIVIMDSTRPIHAIAVFTDQSSIHGIVKMTEDLENNQVKIELNIMGLSPSSLHGFHVHEAGDLSDKCTDINHIMIYISRVYI